MSEDSGKSRHRRLKEAAAAYGEASLHNYAEIRSLAERIAEGFCAFLAPDDPPCVYLVPPKGAFGPRDFGSAAFSVSGAGFLPLSPIAFGLALKVSQTGDWLRIVVTCMQEGGQLVCRITDGETFAFPLPVTDAALNEFFENLYDYALAWFEERVKLYEAGAYGGSNMGFELVHIDANSAVAAPPEQDQALPAAASAGASPDEADK